MRRGFVQPITQAGRGSRAMTKHMTGTRKEWLAARRELLVYHFMFGPDYTAGCPSCSAIADGFNGSVVHLANHDVTLAAVSRAPIAKLRAFKRRMGWSFPWASSLGSDFNYDFQAAYTEEQQRSGVADYNFRPQGFGPSLEAGKEGPVGELAAMVGTDAATYTREAPGMSAFALEDGIVYHTYRSEERRVGKECRYRRSADHEKKKDSVTR